MLVCANKREDVNKEHGTHDAARQPVRCERSRSAGVVNARLRPWQDAAGRAVVGQCPPQAVARASCACPAAPRQPHHAQPEQAERQEQLPEQREGRHRLQKLWHRCDSHIGRHVESLRVEIG